MTTPDVTNLLMLVAQIQQIVGQPEQHLGQKAFDGR